MAEPEISVAAPAKDADRYADEQADRDPDHEPDRAAIAALRPREIEARVREGEQRQDQEQAPRI